MQVVCATLTGVLHRHLDDLAFDVCVIDEAAQALEPACWGALLKAPKAVLAGDHLQLPPTIISDKAARAGLSRTLFERLQAMYGDGVSEMLTVQYRMNAAIMQWSSDELYDGKLTAHSSVADHTLAGCAAAAAADDGKGKGSLASASELPVLLLIDTAGCDMEERQEEEGDSKDNPGEAAAVKAHVARLVSAGIPAAAIGIITPYNAQAALLRETLRPTWPALEISSVDGFQVRQRARG